MYPTTLIMCLLLLLPACMSKSTGICLEYMENGHGHIEVNAGTFGDVAQVNMTGPSRFSKVEKDATTHPCLDQPVSP